ncbi:hypothetical protein BDF22DRAFT_477434 [Syncephalis plumigaleata]|nr:hypothetical protein BDF22DRAFT_477434 [Syncephalis plumigaleata]
MSLTSSNKENAADATDNDNINASYLHVATAVPSPVIRHAIQLQLLPERQSKSLSIVIGRETSLELLSLDTNHVNGVRLASLHRQPIHGTIIRMAALPRWRTIGTASSTIDLTANSEGEEEEDSASISTCTDSCPQCSVTSMNATSTAMDDGDIMSLDDAINEVTHQFPHSLTGYRRWPRSSCIQSRDLLVVTSDAGLLSLLAYGPITAMDYQWTPATASVENATHAPYSSDPSSRFYTVQDIYLGRPGLPFDATGHHLCVDPRSRAIAVAAWQDHIKVFLLKSGTNTSVDVGRHAVSTTSSASMSCPHGYTQCSTKVDPQSEPVDLFARQLDITEEFSLITGMDFLWPSITHMKRILLAVTYTR